MKLTLKTLDGRVAQRKIKDLCCDGYIGDEDPGAALVIVELDDTETYLPIDQFICEEWTEDAVVIKEDWA
nr:MAG TPA: hypothetical protein [Caudoviricetes sp.]